MKKVKILLKDGNSFEGIILERPETFPEGFITLKLDSGYNIGIDKSTIKEIREIGNISLGKGEKVKKIKKIKEKEQKGKEKPKLVILHTGGTIASRVDYSTGGVIAQLSPEDLLEMVPELGEWFKVESRLIANIMSENIRFEHYNLFMKEIKSEIEKGADAIIMGHGTDTMHYTAAALHYGIENLPIPIILVGAQRSSDRPSTDAWLNLKGAALFAKEAIKEAIKNSKTIAGVFIAMHKAHSDNIISILPGYRCRKMHTSSRDAFKPINANPVAEVDVSNEKVNFIDTGDFVISEREKLNNLRIHLYDPELKIAIIKAHPNMSPQEILSYKDFDGIILEGTGLGHFPILGDNISDKNNEILNALKTLSNKIPIIMTSQCINGRVNMDVYAPGRILREIGIEGHLSDLTPEATFIKLAHELSKKKKLKN